MQNRHTVVDNDPSNLYMNFQPNLATRSRENLQKPKKGPKIFFGFFDENPASSLFFTISEKSNEKFCDRRTDRRAWIHRTRVLVQKGGMNFFRAKIRAKLFLEQKKGRGQELFLPE